MANAAHRSTAEKLKLFPSVETMEAAFLRLKPDEQRGVMEALETYHAPTAESLRRRLAFTKPERLRLVKNNPA